MNSAIRLTLLPLSLLIAGGFDICPGIADDITLKVNDLNHGVVAAVALLGQERTVHAQAGTDMFNLIAQYCGTSNAKGAYVGVFLNSNKTNSDISSGKQKFTQDTDLVLPACLYANDRAALVETGRNGPNWNKPIILSSGTPQNTSVGTSNSSTLACESSAKDAKEKADCLGQNLTAIPTACLSPTCQNATKGPHQQVDLNQLSQGLVLPFDLESMGKALVEKVTSSRFQDPTVNDRYQKLLKSALSVNINAVADNSQLKVLSKALEQSIRAQDVQALNGYINFNKMIPSASILVSSFSPDFYSFHAKPDVNSETIAKILNDNNIRQYYSSSAYNAIFAELQTDAEGACGGTLAGADLSDDIWPINVAELKMALRLRQALNRKAKFGPVVVFDTGLPNGIEAENPLDKKFFIKNPNAQTDGELDPYIWTIKMQTYYTEGFEKAFHGVAVTSTALGGIGILKSGLLKDYVYMPDHAVIEQMGYTRSPATPGAADEWALDYPTMLSAMQGFPNFNGPRVSSVNLSLEFRISPNQVDPADMLKTHGEILYVFAAGNNGRSLSSTDYLPAGLGGNRSGNAITVGAIQADHSLWNKSNRGASIVDIAAPGCSVPTLIWDKDANKLKRILANGTSLSAPLVAFAGSLLREDFQTGAEIKLRLLASGRFEPALTGTISSSRSLDVANTVVPFLDGLRMRDGKLRFGHIDWPQLGSYVCGQSQTSKDALQQIAFYSSNEPDKHLMLNVVIRGRYKNFEMPHPNGCSVDPSDLTGVTFREVTASDQGAIFIKSAEPIDPNNTESITFCSGGVTCFDPDEYNNSVSDHMAPNDK